MPDGPRRSIDGKLPFDQDIVPYGQTANTAPRLNTRRPEHHVWRQAPTLGSEGVPMGPTAQGPEHSIDRERDESLRLAKQYAHSSPCDYGLQLRQTLLGAQARALCN